MKVLVLAMAYLLAASVAKAEQLHAYFSPAEDDRGASLKLSPCGSEEVDECISHMLTCSSEWPLVQFRIVEGPVEETAKVMMVGTSGRAPGAAKLADGKTVDLQFSTIHLDANELDANWSLTAGLTDPAPLLDALDQQSAEGAAIVLGGTTFPLAPEKGDGAKLMQLKEACVKMQ